MDTSIFRIFWSGRKASGTAAENVKSDFTWDELPDLAQLCILKYLDRASLNNLRQISYSARFLSENYSGIHVVIPARSWPYIFGYKTRLITDSMVAHLVRQMEGKKIKTLEMIEMPPSLSLPFDKFIQYPAWLKHVRMKYLDVEFINYILSKCRNLKSIHYKSSLWRPLPSGAYAWLAAHASFQAVPIPAMNDILLQKINGFPKDVPKLDHLRVLTLSIDQMSAVSFSDWGNVIFILLALPVLPSLKTFVFEFFSNIRRFLTTHVLIMSCLAELLLKTPNLQKFEYKLNDLQPENITPGWINLICGMIDKLGSDQLKELGNAARVPATPFLSFFALAQEIMNAAALRSLEHLNELDLKLGATNEHALFSGFVARIRSRLTKCQVTDLTWRYEELDRNRRNVYKVFILPDRQPDVLTPFQSLTHLSINCLSTRVQGEASLTRIMGNLPALKELKISQPSIKNMSHNQRMMLMLQLQPEINIQNDPAAPAVFSRLEKLSLQNVNVKLDPGLLVPVLCHFKKLRELKIINDCFSREYFTTRDLIKILGSLPKLNKVHISTAVTFNNIPAHQAYNENYVLDRLANDHDNILLGDVGTVRRVDKTQFKVIQWTLNCTVYFEFLF